MRAIGLWVSSRGEPRAIGGSSPETPTFPYYQTNLPPAYDVAHQPFGLDSTFIFRYFGFEPWNNDSYHELLEQPNSSYPDPLAVSATTNKLESKSSSTEVTRSQSKTVMAQRSMLRARMAVVNFTPSLKLPSPRIKVSRIIVKVILSGWLLWT